jgi:hypothetical protein
MDTLYEELYMLLNAEVTGLGNHQPAVQKHREILHDIITTQTDTIQPTYTKAIDRSQL